MKPTYIRQLKIMVSRLWKDILHVLKVWDKRTKLLSVFTSLLRLVENLWSNEPLYIFTHANVAFSEDLT